MMMPANYSVIAENEMTYVVGGGVIEAIGAVTAPIWTAANVKTFNTNIVTLVGNEFVGKLVHKTVGVLFSGNTSWDDVKNMPKNLFVTGNGIGDDIGAELSLHIDSDFQSVLRTGSDLNKRNIRKLFHRRFYHRRKSRHDRRNDSVGDGIGQKTVCREQTAYHNGVFINGP